MAQAQTENRTRKQSTTRQGGETDPAADVIETAENAIQPVMTRLADFVREQPFQAVGLALGIGYVGRILFRGPVITLAMLGGVGYLGARLAAK